MVRYGLHANIIQDLGPDQGRILSYAQLLWEDILAEKRRLAQAIAVSDRQQLQDVAHSLKGLSSYLEDAQPARFALQLHQGALSLPSGELKTLVRMLTSSLTPPSFTAEQE